MLPVPLLVNIPQHTTQLVDKDLDGVEQQLTYSVSLVDYLAQIILYIHQNSAVQSIAFEHQKETDNTPEKLNIVVGNINNDTCANIKQYIFDKCVDKDATANSIQLKFINPCDVNGILNVEALKSMLTQYFVLHMLKIANTHGIVEVEARSIPNLEQQFTNIEQCLKIISRENRDRITTAFKAKQQSTHQVEQKDQEKTSLYQYFCDKIDVKSTSRKIQTNHSSILKIHTDIEKWWNKLPDRYKNLLLAALVISFCLLIPGATVLIVLLVINQYLFSRDNNERYVHNKHLGCSDTDTLSNTTKLRKNSSSVITFSTFEDSQDTSCED